MNSVEDFVAAIDGGHWFVVVAAIANALTWAIKRFTPLFDRLAPDQKRYVPIALAVLTAVASAALGAMDDWRIFAIRFVEGVIAGVGAIGAYHAVNPEKKKDDPEPPSKPTLPSVLGAGVVALFLAGCAGDGLPLQTADDIVSGLVDAHPKLEAAYAAEGEDADPRWTQVWALYDEALEAEQAIALSQDHPDNGLAFAAATIRIARVYCQLQKLAAELDFDVLPDVGLACE